MNEKSRAGQSRIPNGESSRTTGFCFENKLPRKRNYLPVAVVSRSGGWGELAQMKEWEDTKNDYSPPFFTPPGPIVIPAFLIR